MQDQREFREVMLRVSGPNWTSSSWSGRCCRWWTAWPRPPDLGALVIECTDLVPFAQLIQQRLGVPVFDIVTLTTMVHATLCRRRYG